MATKRIPYQKCSLVWRESKILPNPVFCSYKRKREKQLWSGLRQKLIRTYFLSDDRYRKCQLKCTCFGNMIRMMSQIWQSLCWTTVQSKYVQNINKKRKMPSSSIQPFLCTQTCIVGGIDHSRIRHKHARENMKVRLGWTNIKHGGQHLHFFARWP